MKKLVLVACAVLATGCSKSEDAAEAVNEVADAAKGAVERVQDTAPDLLGSMAGDIKQASAMKLAQIKSTLFDKTIEVLGGIKDVDSAKKSLPQLQDVASNVGALKARLEDMGASVGSPSDATKHALQDQVKRLGSIPGVNDVISKPLNAIVGFFTS